MGPYSNFAWRGIAAAFPAATLLFWVMSAPDCLADLPLSVDLSASVGYDHTLVDPAYSSPFMGELAAGLAIKYNLLDWVSVGILSEYQLLNQYSEPNNAVGNRTGWRWTIAAPMLELHSQSLALKASYGFFGNYNLTNASFAGHTDLSYQLPKDMKISLLKRLNNSPSVWWGLYYETVTYEWSNFATSPLPLETWQAGATIELRLFEPGSSLGF